MPDGGVFKFWFREHLLRKYTLCPLRGAGKNSRNMSRNALSRLDFAHRNFSFIFLTQLTQTGFSLLNLFCIQIPNKCTKEPNPNYPIMRHNEFKNFTSKEIQEKNMNSRKRYQDSNILMILRQIQKEIICLTHGRTIRTL